MSFNTIVYSLFLILLLLLFFNTIIFLYLFLLLIVLISNLAPDRVSPYGVNTEPINQSINLSLALPVYPHSHLHGAAPPPTPSYLETFDMISGNKKCWC